MVKEEKLKQLFSSNTRVKLLSLFLKNPTEKYFVREITRLIDEQVNSVRRELNNLHKIDFIKKENDDNKLYYCLNQNSDLVDLLVPIFTDKKANKIFSWQESTDLIASYLDKVFISGKLNNNNFKIDMLIIGNNHNNQLSNWATQLESDKKMPINYVIMSAKDFKYRSIIADVFLTDFMNSDYKIIFDKEKRKNDRD